MKRLVLLAALFYGVASAAQDCRSYYFLQANKTVEMTIFNKKGDPNGKQVYSITGVSTTGNVTTGALQSELFDKKGKSLAKANSSVSCSGGALMIDMKLFLPQQQQEQFGKAEAKADNVYLEYPSGMKTGDQLKDGHFHMDITMNGGMSESVDMVISDRKVEAKESVTTPAGTWDCFRISYKSKVTIHFVANIPFTIEGTEWLAPGFGIVKSQSKAGGTEITAIK